MNLQTFGVEIQVFRFGRLNLRGEGTFRSCTPGNSSSQEKELCNLQQRNSAPLGQQTTVSSLDPRRRSTTTSTFKTSVWRSRSSDSPEVED